MFARGIQSSASRSARAGFAGCFVALAAVAAADAAPLLSFVPPTSATMVISGGNDNSYIGGNTAGDYRGMTPAQQDAALAAAFTFNSGPAPCISIWQNGELGAAVATAVLAENGSVQVVISGSWRLSERASVTRTIFTHWIKTQASAGQILGWEDSAQATTYTKFEIEPFAEKTYTHPLGQTVTSSEGQGVRGGWAQVGPNAETRVLDAGTYTFRMELYAFASSNGNALAQSAIKDAGFQLCAVPEPASVLMLLIGASVGVMRRVRIA